MKILGISCHYHDSAAALIVDGKLVAAAEEERFTRKKHDNNFPINALNYCLSSHSLKVEDIDYVCLYEKPLLKFERLLFQHIHSFPKSWLTFATSIPSWLKDKLNLRKKMRKLGFNGEIFFIEHHLAHAASSFLVSPFQKAAILTIDGVGEWTTTAYGVGEGNKITLQKEIRFPSSIGLLYSTITAYLGFSVNNSEYKVMGLSAHGEQDKNKNPYYQKLLKTIDIKEDGSFQLDMSYFSYLHSSHMPSKKLCKLFDGPIRKPSEPITQRHKDIAAALQLITEEVLIRILTHLRTITKQDNISLSGGVALNSVANGKILEQTGFKRIWINPNPGDGGSAIGAAFYLYNSILNRKREYLMEDAYLGPSFSSQQVKAFLDSKNIRYTTFKSEKELIDKTACLIEDNKVVGWFRGRMEFGPRALGHRSILANPCNPKMKDILNQKVKHRELFRPFAPAVCAEDASKFFECDNPLPKPTDFMLMVYPLKRQFWEKIPSVVHVDKSGRLQTIHKEQDPTYYNLIKRFGELSGIPIIINTSFNIRGEPIVCTPEQAFSCMMGTGIDCLVMGNYLIKRKDNPKFIWDSEKLAKD